MTPEHPHVEYSGPSLGPVVLDIGGDIGAAVVLAPSELDGAEIEIRRPPEPWAGRHVAVRSRPSPSGERFAAVFGGLEGGLYELRLRGDARGDIRGIVVTGGDVVWHRWETSRRDPSTTPDSAYQHNSGHSHTEKEHSHAG